MNYINWSNEYKEEAEKISQHISEIRKELKEATPIKSREIRSRIATLYQIYYELNNASNLILEYEKGEKSND